MSFIAYLSEKNEFFLRHCHSLKMDGTANNNFEALLNILKEKSCLYNHDSLIYAFCSAEIISQVPDNLADCAICRMSFAETICQLLIKLPCGHVFHYHCGLRAFVENQNCFLCRFAVLNSVLSEEAVENSIRLVGQEIREFS